MFEKNYGYRRFTWVGNRISDDDMAVLYRRKVHTKQPITVQVAEAVRQYIARLNKKEKTNAS